MGFHPRRCLLLAVSGIAAIVAASALAQTTTASSVDIAKVPVSQAKLGAFPFFEFPAEVPASFRRQQSSRFDAVPVIVGHSLHTVEGRVEEREFSYGDARMSADEARRSFQALAARLGGVKVNAVTPADAAFSAAHGKDPELRFKRLRMPAADAAYEAYLIRTAADKRYWIVLMFATTAMKYLAIEEKPMEQTVHFIKPR